MTAKAERLTFEQIIASRRSQAFQTMEATGEDSPAPSLLQEMTMSEPKKQTNTAQDHDAYFDDGPEDCYPNCGGEGFVYSCFEEWACVDPEEGCDLCMHRCDWCRPSTPAPESSP